MAISVRQLMSDIDELAFPARQRLLARTARSLDPSELDELLDGLYGHGDYERRLGLQMAVVARHSRYVERCLGTPDSGVAVRAAVAAVRFGIGGDVLRTRFGSLPMAHRRAVYLAVRRHNSVSTAEVLLPIVRDLFGDSEAASLLSACSAETLESALPELGYAVAGWARIAHRHPSVFLDHVGSELTATPSAEWSRLLVQFGTGLAAVAVTHPDRVIEILDRSAVYAPIPWPLARRIGPLARHDPESLLRILLRPGRQGGLPQGRSVWRALLGAHDVDLIALGRVQGVQTLALFLHVLPPARRAAIYRGVVGERDIATSPMVLAALDEVPRALRGELARGLLELRGVAGDPAMRLAVTARLPWAEAEPSLRTATRRAKSEERAEGYPLYIAAAAATRDPAVVEQMVGSLTRLANEQEPVRSPALQALAQIPPWLYTPAAADGLHALTRDAAQARDSSWWSQRSIRVLASRLIREGAVSDQPRLISVGVEMIEVLGDATRSLNLYGLDRDLPLRAEHQVFEALRGRITSEAGRGQFGLALALAGGLGRRAWEMPELQAVIDQARGAKDDGVVRQAIELWLRPSATRDERVAATLRADRSTIAINAVSSAVGWRRTDLLDEILTKPLHGRFLKRGVRHIPAFHGCFDRWLPRQRATYAGLVVDLAHSQRLPTFERANAVRRLGYIPAPADMIRGFLTDPDTQVVDAALATLAWTDEPGQVLPTLLAYADTDRAHIALSAAIRCARFVAPGQLADTIAPALRSRKITARKEAVRLIAEHHCPDAGSLLAEVWAAPDQHRDVRRAVVSAGRWLLNDERIWDLLAQASVAEELSSAVVELQPDVIAVRHRVRYAALVRTVAASPSSDAALVGLAALPRWMRWDEGASTDLLIRIVGDLTRSSTWREALRALVAGSESDGRVVPLVAVTTELLARHADIDGDPTFNAAVDRDLPARQRLQALTESVGRSAETRPSLRHAAAQVSDLLATSPTCVDLALRLAVSVVAWEIPAEALVQLRHLNRLADRPALAWQAAQQVRRGASQVVRVLDPAMLLTLARALAADTTPASEQVVLALTQVAGDAYGWPDEWRSLLRTYRSHHDPDVRLAAMQTIAAAE